MAITINQIQKSDYQALRVDYTSKDYTNILDDLINSIPGITAKWNTTDANDPGIILVKLMSILGDMLFYEQDLQSLEVYPNSVTQRKNAASIYRLIGYKMRWYRSAIVSAELINTYSSSATLPRFCTFTTENGEITYTNFTQHELKSNTTNNGTVESVELIQGVPVTPSRDSGNPYPETGQPWHSIYGYNYTLNDITNNRIYLNDTHVDDKHLILIDDTGEEWELQDNIYLTTAVGKFFEFGVDVNDNPYIELVDYYNNFNINKFKLFYVRSMGEEGQVYANTLTRITGNVWSKVQTLDSTTVYNVSSFIKFTHHDSSLGYNPETPDEARKNSVAYLNTLDTLITLADFERATLRLDGVANVRATDLTNDPGSEVSYYLGDIDMDGEITQQDLDLLDDYIANPTRYPLTTFQQRLADVNQDGILGDAADRECIYKFLMGDVTHSGYTGQQTLSQTELLPGFTVKLYILRTEAGEAVADEVFEAGVLTSLEDYKILPLNIIVDLHSINKYYWSIQGTFFTKQPLSRDDLQTIIVNINNELKFKYSPDKVNFNTAINYKDVIETILDVDNRILMVDLEPIKYVDTEGSPITKEQLTGVYKHIVPTLTSIGDVNMDGIRNSADVTLLSNYIADPESYPLNADQKLLADVNYDNEINQLDVSALQAIIDAINNDQPVNVLKYNITLPHAPILPGSVMIKLEGGQYTLKDNNNGAIFNIDNLLAKKGTIDYNTGKISLEFNRQLTTDMEITYTHNKTNIATYRNLSTQTFYFDSSSLQLDDMQDLIE